MPASMSAHSYAAPGLGKDELTDDVIETLYDIVRRAQASSDSTSRALFTAYEEVLAELGLRPSDDALLHRFLFRMQSQPRKEEGLVQRFRRVLSELGIDVEVDEDGEGIEVTTGLGGTTRHGGPVVLNGRPRYERRGSFDSFFDGTADKVAGLEEGETRPRTRRGSHDVPATNGYGVRRAQSDTETHSYQQARLPVRNGVNGVNGYQHHRAGSGQYRRASVSSRGSLRIRRDGPVTAAQAQDNDGDDSEYTDRTTSLDLSRVQVPGVNAPIPDYREESSHYDHHDHHDHYDHHAPEPHHYQQYVPEPYRPSDTRLMDDAETFEHQRLHRVTRGCIHKWRTSTREQIGKYREDERLAIAFDRSILLKQSFEQLRDTARMRRAARETDRFFDRLETRADKARNLFLLTKAFTHWASSAEDQVQRTSVARRHILRTRFFNGWREITAVNELKIQHFVLGKFLRVWRARADAVRENSHNAVLVYEQNLVHRLYKEWFFKFCAVAAPAWHNARVKTTMFRKWSEIVRVLRERETWAADRRERTVMTKALQGWRQKTVAVQALAPKADGFRQASLLSTALRSIQKQTQLAPLRRQLQDRVDGRILRTVFQDWRHRAQLSRQARNVDHMRILRNAYTAWNDQLRIQALQQRINDRIIIECLYKWTLASRVSLFQRVHDRQIKESAFLAWVTKTNQRANTLDAAERRFAQFKRAQLMRTCLKKMEVITAEKRAEQFAVAAQYQQKLKQRIFETLKERLEHFQQLNKWAGDAQFYVVSKRALRTWSDATQHKRRERRRDAYAQVRRTVKTNLVRRVFDVWRGKADTIAVQNQQADVLRQTRDAYTSRTLLHAWHDKTITIHQLDTQASNLHTFKLSSRCLHTWTHRLATLQTMHTQAHALRQESTELAASGALKKLGWRLWNVRRQEENARALYERNFEKHVKAMLRFWLEQTLARRPVVQEGDEGSEAGFEDDDDNGGFGEDGDETRRLEAWTAFDENALGLNNALDLELSLTPHRQPPTSTARPPQTSTPYPRPPSPIDEQDEDDAFDDPSAFWSGTPLPPTSSRKIVQQPPPTASKPGYLKTPSKRSVARAKRPELPMSPEKRPVVANQNLKPSQLGSMSAPPARAVFEQGTAGRAGVTSFERRLRDGGFGGTPSAMRGRGRAKGRALGRVGFGDVSEIG
ncbi:Sfi1-domain-containing protein [Dothidotthia symphoricarpi CBS 119687]|uniref:Sfi1-domain-containing protein n=1 Tax=Dothidotthia symphoricarpi CBS 119687 TaxID=1392245 RepID=A0A6A6A2B1_9PLEO|nr:Sfi1-domain-containing protein [Dothidotthia symphoricarpi CBS 119687]KAF2125940.1 Sfi1-domain-containing protein [Dothidotthia symphoricarpi CBS 119687]